MYFVQDNASCHTSCITISWFQKNKINLLQWRALSLDMNPIENLWDIIVKKLTEYCPKTVNDLEQHLKLLVRNTHQNTS